MFSGITSPIGNILPPFSENEFDIVGTIVGVVEKEEIIDHAHSVYGQLSSDGYSVIPNIVPKAKCKELIEVLNQLRIDRENASTTNHTESTKEERWFIEATGQILLRDCLLDRPDVFLEFINCIFEEKHMSC